MYGYGMHGRGEGKNEGGFPDDGSTIQSGDGGGIVRGAHLEAVQSFARFIAA